MGPIHLKKVPKRFVEVLVLQKLPGLQRRLVSCPCNSRSKSGWRAGSPTRAGNPSPSVMPCCCSPRNDGDLHFSHFDGTASDDPFNSPKHQAARKHLPDPASGAANDLYCAQCTFDWRADPSPAQIRNYFSAATGQQLSQDKLQILGSW